MAAAAWPRTEVEVTLNSAKDLKNVNWRHGPVSPYAVVWVEPDRKVTSRVEEEGDTCPVWNEKLLIPLDRPIDGETTLYIDIVHANAAEDTKPLIGSAKLRLRDVVDEAGGPGYSDVAVPFDLTLKRPSGRPQGKIKVEVAIREIRSYQQQQQDPYSYGVRGYGGPPPAAYGGGAPPPAPYGGGAPPPAPYAYPYSAPPSGGYPYAAAPAMYGGGQGSAVYGQGSTMYGGGGGDQDQKKSKFGMGTGLAVGAVAGALGGLALAEGFDALEDHVADEAAEKVEDDLDGDDGDDGDGDW